MRWLLLVVLTTLFMIGGVSTSNEGLAADKAPLVINIDNPSFRKLAFAAPGFFLAPGASADASQFANSGPEELSRLMQFTGYFNVVSEAAYSELLKKAEVGFAGGSSSTPSPKPTKVAGKGRLEGAGVSPGMVGIDVSQWKAVGVETLTLGELTNEGGLTLNLKTIDLHRGEVLVSKKYGNIGKNDFSRVMRRYADAILTAYTGKVGIFNSKLVFVGRRAKSAAKQVYISDFDGTHIQQLTHADAPHLSPEWSKDGRYVTYTSYEDKNPDLFIYDSTAGKHRKLSGRQGINSGASWDPTSRLLAFTGSQDGEAEIYLIRPDGTNRRLLIKGDGLDVDPAFSPDGQKLAFVSGRFGNPHIFVAQLKWDGPEDVRAVSDRRLTFAGWYNASPAWSPEGDKLVFAGYDKDIDRFDLFMVEPDGKNMERLTLRAGDNEAPSYSPNGQLVIFHSNRLPGTAAKGTAQLYIMNRDGSGQRKIDTGLYEAQTPNWSPQFPAD